MLILNSIASCNTCTYKACHCMRTCHYMAWLCNRQALQWQVPMRMMQSPSFLVTCSHGSDAITKQCSDKCSCREEHCPQWPCHSLTFTHTGYSNQGNGHLTCSNITFNRVLCSKMFLTRNWCMYSIDCENDFVCHLSPSTLKCAPQYKPIMPWSEQQEMSIISSLTIGSQLLKHGSWQEASHHITHATI